MMIKRFFVLLTLSVGLLAILSVSAQPTRQLLICPHLKTATYHSGQSVKNADGKFWTLYISDGGSAKLKIDKWKLRFVRIYQSQDSFMLTCESKIGGKTIQANYIIRHISSCYVIPDVDYQLFGCF